MQWGEARGSRTRMLFRGSALGLCAVAVGLLSACGTESIDGTGNRTLLSLLGFGGASGDESGTIILEVPDDLTVECDGEGNPEELDLWLDSATASSDCSEVVLLNNFDGISDECGMSGEAAVTWTARDDCDSVDTASSTFTIIDSTPPTITGPGDLVVTCDENGPDEDLVAWLDSAVGEDVCGEVSVATSLDREGGTCVTEVTWTAADECGLTAMHNAAFTIVGDDEPPVIVLNGPPELVLECSIDDSPLLGASATDFCDKSVTQGDMGGDPLDLHTPGTYNVTYVARDSCGNSSETLEQTIEVVDTLPPFILEDRFIELWPPNHKYHTFRLSDCDVRDLCEEDLDVNEAGAILWAYSDEPENARGDGNTRNDIVIIDDSTFKVRAERRGSGNGRVYGVMFEISDSAGNLAELLCRVGVPHDQSGELPVDDGPEAGFRVE